MTLGLFFIRLLNRVFAYRCESCRRRHLPLMRDGGGEPWLCGDCYELSVASYEDMPNEMQWG